MLSESQHYQSTVYIASAKWQQTPCHSLLQQSCLPDAVLQKAATFSPERAHQYLVSRVLIAELLRLITGILVLPAIYTDHNSRPHFVDPTLPDFNLSHSGDTIVVAMSTNGKIGLDLEQNRENHTFLKVAKKRFSENECDWLTKQPDPLAAFWQLWTIKEAILKLHSKGVWQMKAIEIDPKTLHVKKAFTAQKPTLFINQSTSHHLALSYLHAVTRIVLLDFECVKPNAEYKKETFLLPL